MDKKKVIISLAPVEAGTPVDADALAEDVKKSAELGAAMCHLHCRRPDGSLTPDISYMSECFDRILAKTDVVVQASTGGVSDLTIEERCFPLDYKPTESASLNGGTTNLGEAVYINSFDDNRYMDERFSGMPPERTMLLCFNYTGTVKEYEQYGGLILNYIHGELEHPEHIIFGYGDELDKDYQDILDKQDNELLKNVKSVKYLETKNYHKMLDFLMAAPFQVLIMGHSCGNSDRTLLNTVFEHENCVSIKPFYHKWEDGSDNYLELVQNISRNFTNMKLFRDRVVNKEQCLTI